MTDELDASATAADEPRRDRRLGFAVGAAIAFALIAVVMTVIAAKPSDTTDDRDEVAEVAGQFAEALSTIDAKKPEAYLDRLLALATGGFATDVEKQQNALDENFADFRKRGFSQEATVRQVYVSDVDADSAEAIVEVRNKRHERGKDTFPPSDFVQLDLVRVKDGWRVDNMTFINAPVGELPSPTGATTSTTAKASSGG